MWDKIFWGFLFTISGVGLIYILSQRITIRDGYRGISYNNGKLEVLQPGVHWLISPFHTLDRIIPFQQDNSLRLNETRVKTTDNIEIKLQADIIYRVVNAESLVLHAPSNATSMLADLGVGILSSIYNSYSLEQISPNPIQDQNNNTSNKALRTHDNEGVSIHSKVRDNVLAQLNTKARDWGLQISNFQITKIDFVDTQVMEQLAKPTITILEANAKLGNAAALAKATIVDAEAKAKAITIEATAKAQAIIMLADGFKQAVETTKSSDPEISDRAFQLLLLRTQGEALTNCDNVTLITGTGNGGPLFLSTGTGTSTSSPVLTALSPAPTITAQG